MKNGATLALATIMSCFGAATAATTIPNYAINPTEAAATATGVLRGRIVSDDGTSLPGSVVFIENLHMSTITDADGYYTLSNIPAGHQTVKISYVGYATKELEVTIGDKQTSE